MEQGGRILLVEDDAVLGFLTAKTLGELGFEVVSARDEASAVEKAEGEIDLVLMDIDLGSGRAGGFRASEEILRMKDVPIVFHSSFTERGIIDHALSISDYGYVVKGEGPSSLTNGIRTALRLFRERHEKRVLERRYKMLLDKMPCWMVELSYSDHRISDCNTAVEATLGKKRDEIISRTVEEVFPEKIVREHLPLDRTQVQTGFTKRWTGKKGADVYWSTFIPVQRVPECLFQVVVVRNNNL